MLRVRIIYLFISRLLVAVLIYCGSLGSIWLEAREDLFASFYFVATEDGTRTLCENRMKTLLKGAERVI